VLTAAQWNDAVRGRFHRPIKQQITARIDAILHREMLAARKA
jgi:hypothetical protein